VLYIDQEQLDSLTNQHFEQIKNNAIAQGSLDAAMSSQDAAAAPRAVPPKPSQKQQQQQSPQQRPAAVSFSSNRSFSNINCFILKEQ
jgi:hypothetical protein